MILSHGISNEAKRLDALRSYQILGTLPDKEFDRLTKLAATICDTPIALVSLVDEHSQWFKSKFGIDVCEINRNITFCEHTIKDTVLLEVEDATQDIRFKDNPSVTGEPYIRYYAGIPLTDPYGYNLGTLCVIDQQTRKLSANQKASLALIAESITDLIIDHRAKQEFVQFEQLFALSKDLICVVDTNGFLKKINPAFKKVLGWSQQQLLSASFFNFIHPDDLHVLQQEIVAQNTRVTASYFSFRVQNAKGTYNTFQWTATAETTTGLLFAIGRDVTEEKRKENQLYRSEQRFRTFFEHSHGLMCTHDLKGNLLTVNTAGAKLLGYTPDQLVGHNLGVIIAPEFRDGLKKYIQTIETEGKASGVMHTQHRDGRTMTWLFNNVLELDADGNSYIIGNAIDITERHQLEADLKHTKETMEETNAVARIGSWDLDMDNHTLYWSSVTKRIHGVNEDYVPDYETAFSFYHGEHLQTISDAVKDAVENGNSFDVEVQIVTAEGKELWVRAIGKAEFKKGCCKRLFGTFQDINEKKEAKQDLLNEKLRLAAFVEHAPVAVVMMDESLKYIAVSKRFRENYQVTENVIGRSQYDLFPELSEKWISICNRCLKGEEARGDEFRWRRPGFEKDIYLHWEIVPWYQYDGTIGGIMVSTEDVTASRVQRDELKRAKLHAEQSSNAKSEFLANMSHEIRTPLNGVIGFTDLVLKTKLNTTQHQYLSIVNQSANALLSIINDILDFSKIEAGKLELEEVRCDIFDISSQAADIVSYQIQKKGLEILVNVSPDLPRYIWIDEVRIKQVLVNLLGNAVKFTEKGEIELKIIPLGDADGVYADFRFEVRDTGIGIKEDKQNKIFEAFSQEDVSTTRQYGGTGLGLTISNKLLDMMGSRLQLKSKEGIGSSFYFDIRLKTEKGESEYRENLDAIKKVLIVDDNENNRLIVKQLLALKNIASHEASSGIETLQLLAEGNHYDAIIMDYHMHFMDGIETVRQIRQNVSPSAGQIPVMLLHSSSDDESIIRQCQELQIMHHLVKPVKMQELYQGLGKLVGNMPANIADNTKEPAGFKDRNLIILVAEDNIVNKQLARSILNRVVPNATILEADNGEQAITLHSQADIILMDIQMPVMNGYEAAEKIRAAENGRRVPIIALTAGNVKGEKEKCLAAGMDDFVAKPFVEESIIKLFNTWLQRSDMRKEEAVPGENNLSTTDHFNPEWLLKLIGDDKHLMTDILVSIVNELDNTVRLINSDQTIASLNSLGHKLYGTAVSAGMQQLATLAKKVELTQETDRNHIPNILKELQEEALTTKKIIERYIVQNV